MITKAIKHITIGQTKRLYKPIFSWFYSSDFPF